METVSDCSSWNRVFQGLRSGSHFYNEAFLLWPPHTIHQITQVRHWKSGYGDTFIRLPALPSNWGLFIRIDEPVKFCTGKLHGSEGRTGRNRVSSDHGFIWSRTVAVSEIATSRSTNGVASMKRIWMNSFALRLIEPPMRATPNILKR